MHLFLLDLNSSFPDGAHFEHSFVNFIFQIVFFYCGVCFEDFLDSCIASLNISFKPLIALELVDQERLFSLSGSIAFFWSSNHFLKIIQIEIALFYDLHSSSEAI